MNLFRALSSPNFRRYWSGQALSQVGYWLQQIALTALVYRLTGSKFLLGLVSFCAFIPILPLATFAGTWIDSIDKRKALLVTQCLALTQAMLLAILTFSNQVEVWHILVLALFLGIVTAFDMPLRQSSIIELIEDKSLISNAISLNSMQFNAARVIGPALGGGLILWVGEAWCFLLNGLSYLFIIYALLTMRWVQAPQPAIKRPFLKNWQEGCRYVWGTPIIRWLLAMVGMIGLTVGSYSSLLPAIAKELFNGGADVQSALLVFAGVGAITGNLWLAGRRDPSRFARGIAATILCAGGALLLLAQVSDLWIGLPLMLLLGAGIITSAAATNSLLQMLVENDKRGRVMSFYAVAFTGLYPIGSLIAGWLSEWMGLRATFMLQGGIAIICAGFFWHALPRLSEQMIAMLIARGQLSST